MSRLTVGRTERLLGAFGNMFTDLGEVLRDRLQKRSPSPLALNYQTAEDGLRSTVAVQAAAGSARAQSRVNAAPSLLAKQGKH